MAKGKSTKMIFEGKVKTFRKGGKTFVCCDENGPEIVSKKAYVDTSELMEKLREMVGKKGLAVYNIHVCRAGYGISYANGDRESVGGVLRVKTVVYHYHPTLRKAVLAEMRPDAEWRTT